MLIDSHAHLFSSAFDHDLEEVLLNAQKASVEKVVVITTTPDECTKAINFNSSKLLLVGGTTPHDVETLGESDFAFFEQMACEKRLSGLGETGLDYHYEHSDREKQKHYFCKYLHLAKAHKLPIVIHCREAFEDLFAILDEEYTLEGKHLPGVLHCFTGTAREAQEVIARGLYLSLSGIVTFKNSSELREIAKDIPLERLLIETDAPYLAPNPYRGKRNEPSFLRATAECLATIKNLPFETVAEATSNNAMKLFAFDQRK